MSKLLRNLVIEITLGYFLFLLITGDISKYTDNTTFWILGILIIPGAFLIKLCYENRIAELRSSGRTTFAGVSVEFESSSDEYDYDDEEEDEPDLALINSIELTRNVNDLMGLAHRLENRGIELVGKENDRFLDKALQFESDLTEDDWDIIYDIAGEDSRLEEIALEKR